MSTPTSIVNLAPIHAHTIQLPLFKFTQQTQGSFQWQLRRVSRTPAFSRPYVAGDPIRLIDWRAFARNDQLLVREQREAACARVLIILDIAGSMQWPDAAISQLLDFVPPMKLELAVRIALNLCFLHLKQGDEVAVLPADFTQHKPPPRLSDWGMAYRFRATADILGLYDEYVRTGFRSILLEQAGLSTRLPYEKYDLVYVVSDGFRREMIEIPLEVARHLHMIHVLSSLETQQEWISPEYAYLETTLDEREYLGQILLGERGLAAKVGQWRESFVQWVRNRGGSYQLVTDRTTIEEYFSLLGRMTKDE